MIRVMVPLTRASSWTVTASRHHGIVAAGVVASRRLTWLGRGQLLEGRTVARCGTRGRSDSVACSDDSNSLGPYRPLQLFPTTTHRVLLKYTPNHHRKPGNDANRPSPPRLKAASEEQQAISAALGQGATNVIVNAVAGSGKTTTILHVARDSPHLQLLCLTYNRRLKDTTTSKAKSLNLTNLKVHTFHGAGMGIYGNRNSHTNKGLMEILEQRTAPKRRLYFDVLVVDEAQDCRPLLFKMAVKLLNDCSASRAEDGLPPPQVLLLGDVRQTLYQFMEADGRYLSLADAVLCDSSPWPWVRLPLHTSRRCSGAITSFINRCMLGANVMKLPPSTPPGPPVEYVVGHGGHCASYVAEKLIHELNRGEIEPEDIFVLAASVDTKSGQQNAFSEPSPLHQLENLLVNAGVPVFAPSRDLDSVSDKELRGKCAFTTFHSSKGLERKVVVLFGFDVGYFEFYARQHPQHVCPNTLYVAATRATQWLMVVGESTSGRHLPFLRRDLVEKNLPFVRLVEVDKLKKEKLLPPKSMFSMFHVSSLVQWLPDDVLEAAPRLLQKRLSAPTKNVCIEHSVPSTTGVGQIETVSELTGIALPSMYEHRCMERITIQDALQASNNFHVPERLLTDTPSKPSDYLELAAWYASDVNGFLFKPNQLLHYEWLPHQAAQECLNILEEQLPPESVEGFEMDIRLKYNSVHLKGQMDVVCNDAVFELKCVNKICPEHILQLVVYAFMWNHEEATVSPRAARVAEARSKKAQRANARRKEQGLALANKNARGSRAFRLLNMRTGELWQLTDDQTELQTMVDSIIEARLRPEPELSDEQFVRQALSDAQAARAVARPSHRRR